MRKWLRGDCGCLRGEPLLAGTAGAATVRVGTLVLHADGGFEPQLLPKRAYAPIHFQGYGDDQDHRRLDAAGAAAREARIRPRRAADDRRPAPSASRPASKRRSPAQARRRCHGAIVGTGQIRRRGAAAAARPDRHALAADPVQRTASGTATRRSSSTPRSKTTSQVPPPPPPPKSNRKRIAPGRRAATAGAGRDHHRLLDRRPLRQRRPLPRRRPARLLPAAVGVGDAGVQRAPAGPGDRRRRLAVDVARAPRGQRRPHRAVAAPPAPRRLLAPRLGRRGLRRHRGAGPRGRRLGRRVRRRGLPAAGEPRRARARALVGPWGHMWPEIGRPGPEIGFLQECVRWWDEHLKGRDTGIMDEPMLRAWMQEPVAPAPDYDERPGRWVAEAAWPGRGRAAAGASSSTPRASPPSRRATPRSSTRARRPSGSTRAPGAPTATRPTSRSTSAATTRAR